MLTDIEIAQATQLRPIQEIAAKAGIPADWVEPYGKYKAKIVKPNGASEGEKNGKLILVTAINPTPAGEGKTTTTIGLADALNRLGKKTECIGHFASASPI